MLLLATGCATINSSDYLPTNTYHELKASQRESRASEGQAVASVDVVGFWSSLRERGAKALPSIGKDVVISIFWAYVISEAVDEIKYVVDEMNKEEENL